MGPRISEMTKMDENLSPLTNKVAIITGANQGLGAEIAKKYVEAGASLVLCARNGSLLKEVHDRLSKSLLPSQRILAIEADVSRDQDVRSFIRTALNSFERIDILVNNAGILGPKGQTEDTDWQEWIRTIEINLFGSILMCREILPHFKGRRSGKIIQLSGGGATKPMPWLGAYAVSKAGIVRFIETLAEEVRGFGIDANAIAPGALNTRMLDEVLDAGPERVGQSYFDQSIKQQKNGGSPLSGAADLAVFLGSSQSDGITGKLISAVWDPWRTLPDHLHDLQSTDIYTLRRILPKDRAMNWGEE